MSEPDRQRLVQENEALKSQLDELIQLAQGAPLGTGVCMCGDPIEEHGRAHNHSAVDIWDHAFEKFLDKHGLHNGTQAAEATHPLAYTDPESPNPEVDNAIHQVSGIKAGEAYNDLCRMIGGQYPDCRIQEEAPKAHQFFMALFGANGKDVKN